jgi:hypothetical protein
VSLGPPACSCALPHPVSPARLPRLGVRRAVCGFASCSCLQALRFTQYTCSFRLRGSTRGMTGIAIKLWCSTLWRRNLSSLAGDKLGFYARALSVSRLVTPVIGAPRTPSRDAEARPSFSQSSNTYFQRQSTTIRKVVNHEAGLANLP